MDINRYLTDFCMKNNIDLTNTQFPNCDIDPNSIKVIMISEVPPKNPDDYFYSNTENTDYLRTTLGVFQNAGVNVTSIKDILELGIYITTAMKTPKPTYVIDPAVVTAHLPILEEELKLFPNLEVVMLMGDVAAKSLNLISKARTKKAACPAGAAGRRRHWNGEEFYFGTARVIPSYIMTGKNLLIEPFKCDTISEDIRRMMGILKGGR